MSIYITSVLVVEVVAASVQYVELGIYPDRYLSPFLSFFIIILMKDTKCQYT